MQNLLKKTEPSDIKIETLIEMSCLIFGKRQFTKDDLIYNIVQLSREDEHIDFDNIKIDNHLHRLVNENMIKKKFGSDRYMNLNLPLAYTNQVLNKNKK